MNKDSPGALRIIAMAAFALSCFGLLSFLWISFGGAIPLKAKGYRFEVGFEEATQLAAEADVRVAGVPIGKVRKKYQDKANSRTVALIEIDRKYAPIPEDARATLRQKTVLGETYVELTTGTEGGPYLAEGERLRNRRVQDTVYLDELLDSLDPYTRRAYRTWQQEGGRAIKGRGQDVNDALRTLPDFVESGGDLFAVLDNQKGVLQALVKNTGVTFRALTAKEDQLRNLITAQDEVFSAIADEREAFAETFRIFPTFLEESRKTFRRLETFSADTRPLVRDMRPALEDLDPALEDLGALSPDLRRLFVNLDPLLTVSRTSLPATREVFDGLRPVLRELPPFLGQVNPILEYIGLHVYTLTDMLANLGVATAAKVKDPRGGNGHYLRQFGATGAESAAMHPRRLETNRGNAFLPPLGQLSTPTGVRQSLLPPPWDCANARGGDGKPPDSSPSCRVAPTIRFKNLEQRFPQVGAASYPERR